MNNFGRNLALWVIIGFLLIMLFNMFQSPSGQGPQDNLAYSDFIGAVKSGNVRNVTIHGSQVTGNYEDGRSFSTYAPDDPALVVTLTEYNVRISAGPSEEGGTTLSGFLLSMFPMLLLIGVWIFFMRQMQSGRR